MKRNERGDDKLYISPENQGFKMIKEMYTNKTAKSTEAPILIDGVQGTVLIAGENVPLGSYVFLLHAYF